MDARGQLLEIASRTRRQLAENAGATATIFFQATEPAAPWSLIPFGDSPAVTEIASMAVLELGEVAIGAFDHLPPHIRGAVRPYRHDPAATWSRIVGILVETQGKVFGSPDPFCGIREFAFTRIEDVTAGAAEGLAAMLPKTLASAPPAAPPAEPLAVVSGKRTKGHGKRGRPPKDDPNRPTEREYEAAWRRDQAVRRDIGIDKDCPDDINLRKVFNGLNSHRSKSTCKTWDRPPSPTGGRRLPAGSQPPA